MLGSCASRRFPHTFYRWNYVLASKSYASVPLRFQLAHLSVRDVWTSRESVSNKDVDENLMNERRDDPSTAEDESTAEKSPTRLVRPTTQKRIIRFVTTGGEDNVARSEEREKPARNEDVYEEASRKNRLDLLSMAEEPRIRFVTTAQEDNAVRSEARYFATANAVTNIRPVTQEEESKIPSFLSDRTRLIMRRVPNTVVVITALTPPTSTAEELLYQDDPIIFAKGMAVSSFTTVSLDPTPIVSFNIKRPSRTWDAIRAQNQLRVHFLAPTFSGKNIAKAFSHAWDRDPFKDIRPRGVEVVVPTPEFGVHYRAMSSHRIEADLVKERWERGGTEEDQDQRVDYINLSPHLRHPSILASMSCELLPEKCVEVNDHVIVVAEVVRLGAHAYGPGDKPDFFEEIATPSPDQNKKLRIPPSGFLAYCNASFQAAKSGLLLGWSNKEEVERQKRESGQESDNAQEPENPEAYRKARRIWKSKMIKQAIQQGRFKRPGKPKSSGSS